MSHTSTERLIDYWRARKPAEGAPARAAIDPMQIAALLPQVFILGRSAPGAYVFRLAGEFINEIHGRDLRGQDLVGLWATGNQRRLASALEASRRQAEPLLALVSARSNEGMTLPLEMAFAPLVGPSGETDRMIGLYQPLGLTNRLMGRTIDTLALLSLMGPDIDAPPHLKLATVDGRRIA